jgi:hypothetical protein
MDLVPGLSRLLVPLPQGLLRLICALGGETTEVRVPVLMMTAPQPPLRHAREAAAAVELLGLMVWMKVGVTC